MRFIRTILIVAFVSGLLGLGWVMPARAAEQPKREAGAAAEEGKEEGVPQKASEISGRLGAKIPITNSMIVSWVVALGLIIFARVAMKNAKEIPGGAQNFWEWMVESLHDFLAGII